uniref:Transposase n=1 Tax=Panagrolaimus superbus TaxID=310955 RepID=A0A914Y5C1_9BILA
MLHSTVTLGLDDIKTVIGSQASDLTAKSFFKILLDLTLAHPADFESRGTRKWPMQQVVYVAEILMALIFLYHGRKRSASTKRKWISEVTEAMGLIVKSESTCAGLRILRRKYDIEEPLGMLLT